MEKITLNMTPSACLTTCHASQYDIGRQVRFDLVNGSSAFTLTGAETVTLKIRRADGVVVENSVPNTSDSYVIWTSVSGECDAAGVSECELRVTDGDDVLGSANFLMSVEADPYEDADLHIVELSGSLLTFETTLPEPFVSCKASIVASQPSGTPTPSSPLAISGYTGLNLTVCGKNLFDKNGGNVLNAYLSTKIESLAVCRTVFVKCKPSTTYTVIKTAGQRFIVAYTKELPDINVDIYGSIQDATASNITITTGADAKYIVAMVYNGNVDSGTAEEMLASVQIAEGTDTTYHAYNGTTYAVSWQDEAGTVYGGVLDVARGLLTVTKAYVDVGQANWSMGNRNSDDTGYIFYVPITNFKSGSFALLMSSIYKFDAYQSTWENLAYGEMEVAGGNTLIICDNYNSVSALQTAQNGQVVVYELATPQTYQLTPTQVRALVGVNNVFADTGDIDIKYLTED